MLTADLAVIFFKYIHSPSSSRMSSNGLLMLLLKVSAMWTYISVVRILLCPISSFTIFRSVPCSIRLVANAKLLKKSAHRAIQQCFLRFLVLKTIYMYVFVCPIKQNCYSKILNK